MSDTVKKVADYFKPIPDKTKEGRLGYKQGYRDGFGDGAAAALSAMIDAVKTTPEAYEK